MNKEYTELEDGTIIDETKKAEALYQSWKGTIERTPSYFSTLDDLRIHGVPEKLWERLSEDIPLIKIALEEDRNSKVINGHNNNEIKFIDTDKDWKEIKQDLEKSFRFISKSGEDKLFMDCHKRDTIEGKPQLIDTTFKKIPLVRKVIRYDKQKEKEIVNYKFLDDRYDKRYDGQQVALYAESFMIYRVRSNNHEYFVLSKEVLGNEKYTFNGMGLEMDDFSELSSTLKIKSIGNIFFSYEANPSIKTLDKETLVNLTKEAGKKFQIDYEGFEDYVFTHEDGNVYKYTDEFNKLRIAQLLSGKIDGYPLHLLKVGPPGTGKTIEQETLNNHLVEEQGILEAGSSTLKSLEPSFKSKPANLGYIASCNRFAMVDELFKMIEATINKMHSDHRGINEMLGSLNFLLEQKERTIGSGNDNMAVVKSTAKLSITSNPLSKSKTIYQHVGIVDESTLSRMLVWVQDEEEQSKVYSRNFYESKFNIIPDEDHVLRRTHNQEYTSINHSKAKLCLRRNKEKFASTGSLTDFFLSVYDSCQVFVCDFDKERLKNIWKSQLPLCKEPMKRVWNARGLHHASLVLDGLIKYRCLFRDYDSTFTPKDEDYELCERILFRMIRNFDTDLSKREHTFGGF